MDKNRFNQLLESTMGDVKPLIVESKGYEDFVVANDTTVEGLEAYLEEKTEAQYDYGSARTLEYIIEDLVQNSLMASGKSEQESESMAKDFVKKNMTNNTTYIPDQYDYYERREGGENSYKQKVIFEFTCGGDGYGYSGSFNDLTELLADIKSLVA